MLTTKIEILAGEEKKDAQEVWGLEEKKMLLLGMGDSQEQLWSPGAALKHREDLSSVGSWSGPGNAL